MAASVVGRALLEPGEKSAVSGDAHNTHFDKALFLLLK
jgi:hypothetical protein